MILLTRGSPLARIQTRGWMDALESLGAETTLQAVSTHGDRDRTTPLPCFGGFGAFVKALEEKLLAGEGDGAVHSLKDVPVAQPEGLVLAGVLPRGPVGDLLVTREGLSLETLPPGARVGSSSLRRTAQGLRVRKDLRFLCCRGNVQTRLRKLEAGELDALILAEAGVRRLGLDLPGAVRLPFLSTPGQGAVALETRAGSVLESLARQTNHLPTWLEVCGERQVLGAFGKGCSAPVAVQGRYEGDVLTLEAEVLALDGSQSVGASLGGPAGTEEEARALGQTLWDSLAEAPLVRRLLEEVTA